MPKWAELSPQQQQANRDSAKRRHRERRSEALSHYGGECVCCGEAQPEFLHIDHEDGGGVKHRKEIGGSGSLIHWLRRNGYPPGFRVLCANCNMAIGAWGSCPHWSSSPGAITAS